MLCFGVYLDVIGNMKLCKQINTEEGIYIYIYIYIYVTNFNEALMGVNTRSITVS